MFFSWLGVLCTRICILKANTCVRACQYSTLGRVSNKFSWVPYSTLAWEFPTSCSYKGCTEGLTLLSVSTTHCPSYYDHSCSQVITVIIFHAQTSNPATKKSPDRVEYTAVECCGTSVRFPSRHSLNNWRTVRVVGEFHMKGCGCILVGHLGSREIIG